MILKSTQQFDFIKVRISLSLFKPMMDMIWRNKNLESLQSKTGLFQDTLRKALLVKQQYLKTS